MGHTQSSNRVPPTPALVLVLDQMGLEVAADVESIFLTGDRRRAAVTRFLALAYKTQGGPAFVPLQAASAPGCAPEGRREASQGIADRAALLRAGLDDKLRELHAHQRLLEAGLGDVLSPPLDIFLVADLTRPASSGAVLPLAYMIQNLIAQQPYGKGHLLLSTASFGSTGASATADAQAYVALQELDSLLDPAKSTARKPLLKAIGFETDSTLSLPVYLFDHHKEGTREVRDRAELRLILGNFLLALLSGGLAQRLAEERPLPEVQERRAFFSSGAATALVFEPQALIDACAGRSGAEYITAEMGPDPAPDPRASTEWAERREMQMGSPRQWMDRLCSNTPCELESDGNGLHLGLHFHGFCFDAVPEEEWADKIASYSTLFGATKSPRYKQLIMENARALSEETASVLESALEALPKTAQLYPGGLGAAHLALRKLDERLEDRAEKLSSGARAVPQHEEASLKALDLAAWSFPDLPAFVARTVILCAIEVYALFALGHGLWPRSTGISWLLWPVVIGVAGVTAGACALWLWRKDQRMVALRERAIRRCELRHAILLEGSAREDLITLCGTLRSRVASALGDIPKLEQSLAAAKTRLKSMWQPYGSTELSTGGTDWDGDGRCANSPFRPSPVDPAVAEWVYDRWRQAPQDMRVSLLGEQGLLSDWRTATADTLAQRLLAYGQRVFAPVRELTVGDLLHQRKSAALDAVWTGLARETILLLRPVFDSLGGGGHFQSARLVLVESRDLAGVAQRVLPDWQLVPTSDPYVAACCRVGHIIPLAALKSLCHRGQNAYDALEAHEKGKMWLLDGQGF